jgi:hypothetical protein
MTKQSRAGIGGPRSAPWREGAMNSTCVYMEFQFLSKHSVQKISGTWGFGLWWR